MNLSPAADFRAMEEMFDRVFGSPSRPAATTLPVDITENDGKLYVRAAVPGIEPNELDIQIEKNVLTIRGEARAESTSQDEKVYRREVSYGSFGRSIRLPEGLNLDETQADFKNGIVTITLPRLPEEKPKSLKVTVRTNELPSEQVQTQEA
ncbi:Hsp20/alpha crystallin family protein [Fimbriimonas ginsengisoli]|uniref:Hsp20/alpha crystallin family protein n=1 Tax=Fimbriimonas ginsengisoli TaxID=1005039 RepID=UPI001D0F09D9|nr:Hsp20/alpha crystallin family protein [Fimbriimonas ginsengisoli]